jgi:pilus assembly protein Flp/PilA
MKNLMQQFWRDEEGVTAIEYSLLAALVALAIIAGATALGGDLNTAFSNIANVVSTNTPAS